MNISGEFSIGKRLQSGTGQSTAADQVAFNQAMDIAVKKIQTIVPMANEMDQMALTKKKEKKTINRVQDAKEAADDSPIETVDQVVKHIALQIRFLAEMERRNIGL